MLSVEYPSIRQTLDRLRYGLLPIFIGPSGVGAFVLKVPKETILAARLKNEIKVYPLPDEEEGTGRHLGVVTGFFDDNDEPLTIATALFNGDELLTDVTTVLSQPTIDLFFFDEHGREWMGIRAIHQDADRCRRAFGAATFAPFDIATYNVLTNRLARRFSSRDEKDDRLAFSLTLGERHYPDDDVVSDDRAETYGFREARLYPAVGCLVREDPGPPQERDIAVLFGRVFPAESIYLNPFRVDTGKELTDVLVVTERVMLFVEAKDSPNTAASLSRSLARKRQAIQKQIEKATKQLRGGLGYAQARDGLSVRTKEALTSIPRLGRQLLGLVVVREMLDGDQFENSAPVLVLVNEMMLPVMLIDYPGLHMISLNLTTPGRFIGALHDVFDAAMEHGQFPRSVWHGPPPPD